VPWGKSRCSAGYGRGVPEFAPLTLPERIEGWKHRIAFERAQRSWISERRREVTAELGMPPYEKISVWQELGPRPPHVVVVPQEGRAFDSFRPGTRNFYYEAWRNLAEEIGEESVSVFHVDPGESPSSWHIRLLDYVVSVGATHVITHIEADPGSSGSTWTWDTAWGLLSSRWDGVLLGVMFDSAFEWIAAKSRLLARMSPRYMVVDICMPMNGSMVRRRPEVGPVNMPVSRESLALVDARLAEVEPSWDVSFIGVMYPYRMELVSRLRALGISVAVNPHREDRAEDDAGSRVAQPSWLDYMAGLRSSRMTLNFSQSSAGRFEQLKTRVIEATLAGTLLLTDDVDRTRLFWTPEEEFGSFRAAETAGPVIQSYLSNPQRLADVAAAGERRARSLAHSNFWGGIEVGLRRRGLPSVVFGESAG
jgi:hypothetical protein